MAHGRVVVGFPDKPAAVMPALSKAASTSLNPVAASAVTSTADTAAARAGRPHFKANFTARKQLAG